ncbi:dimethylsulfoxide reductase [Testudinibacter aquarius]|uniref:Dimethylsulfoxide reductase n=2 Tax=Testudinibacter aquarius TaxID=1524974 RepID=A0ABY2XYQ6_9PAST|nr:dimethylsulfoxide reductase [Testudinibacter aquarius]
MRNRATTAAVSLPTRRRCNMGMGLHEWPLVFFTVLAQSAVGAFWVFTLLLLTEKSERAATRTHYVMTVLWGLMAIGFIFSTLHLGSPQRAFNALNRIGASGLSNEIAAGSAFFALGAGYWALATARLLPQAWQKLPVVGFVVRLLANISAKLPSIWRPLALIVVSIVGAAFIYAMSKLYMIPTVPTWNSVFTPLSFLLTALLGGSTLALALLNSVKAAERLNGLLLTIAWLAFIAAVIVTYQQYGYLAGISSAIHQALDLVPSFVPVMLTRFVLIAIGLLLLTVKKANTALPFIGVLLIIAAELLARIIFYGLHMTVGMAALGY